jgi:hypothetical protein
VKTHVLTGSKNEIADRVIQIDGKIHQVIVFVEEPSDSAQAPSTVDIFAEMEPFMVKADWVDYSRQSLHTRMEGE